MTDKPPKDWDIEYSEQAKAQMDADPEIAEAMREMAARLRQAMHGVETGLYASIDDAMDALGAEPVDPDEIMGEDDDEGR